jgi:hypothetical protein
MINLIYLRFVMTTLPINGDYMDVGAISKAHEEEIATRIGYHSSDFKWFGSSIPEDAKAVCLLCDNVVNISLEEFMKNDVPEFCPRCRRKGLKIHDIERWKRYAQIKLWEFEFFLDQFRASHAIYNNGSRHVFRVDSQEMKRVLAGRCKNPNDIKTITTYLDGLAGSGGVMHQMENRIAKRESGIWIDAATKQGEAFNITSNGWRVVDKPPLFFRHFEHQLPIVAESGYKKDFDEYLSLMNLSSEEDRILFAGYAATLFIPDIDHPIIMPLGPQGSAKTTMSLMTKMLIDPSKTPLLTVPDNAEKLPMMFHFNYFPVFDNCKYFPQEASDMFCRACTGGGISTRKLYTDMEEVCFSFHSPIILNSVSCPSMSQDFIDRTMIINLDRILEQNRKEKGIIDEQRDALLPRVRGYLMGIVADAIGSDAPTPPLLPRLADFARRADACATAMGFKQGSYIETYILAARESAMEAVRSDLVAEALLDYLEETGSWDGPASELLKHLAERVGSNSKSPNWPKDSSKFSDALFGRLKPGLGLLGWNVARNKSHGVRSIRLWKEETKNGGLLTY